MLIAVLIEGTALLAAILFAAYFDIHLLPLTDKPVRDIFIGTAGAVVPFILFLFTLSKTARRIPLFSSLRETVITDVRAIFRNMKLTDLMIISLLAGFAEEMFFRGVLQTKFGIIAASVIFGLFHSVSFAYVIVTILMGFYIGMLFHVSGSLLVPIHLHFIYDFAALTYLSYFVKVENGQGNSSEEIP